MCSSVQLTRGAGNILLFGLIVLGMFLKTRVLAILCRKKYRLIDVNFQQARKEFHYQGINADHIADMESVEFQLIYNYFPVNIDAK